MVRRHPQPSPWAGIDPQSRPTPERMQHDRLVPTDFKENGVGRVTGRVTINRTVTPIDRAFEDGALPRRLRDAALHYEERVRRATEHNATPRDSLDMTPRGGGDAPSLQERLIAAKQELRRLEMNLSPYEISVLRHIVVDHEPTGQREMNRLRWRTLVLSLLSLANYLQLPADE